jgi:hypothetical protein
MAHDGYLTSTDWIDQEEKRRVAEFLQGGREGGGNKNQRRIRSTPAGRHLCGAMMKPASNKKKGK